MIKVKLKRITALLLSGIMIASSLATPAYAIYSYYSNNLDIGRFSKNNAGDERYESYARNELNKVRTKDIEVLPNLLNQRFIVFNSFNEFSDFDKVTFEALTIDAIKNRKALQLGPLENQTLRQYLSR